MSKFNDEVIEFLRTHGSPTVRRRDRGKTEDGDLVGMDGWIVGLANGALDKTALNEQIAHTTALTIIEPTRRRSAVIHDRPDKDVRYCNVTVPLWVFAEGVHAIETIRRQQLAAKGELPEC